MNELEPHFPWFVLCLYCEHTWRASIHWQAPLLRLQCPECGGMKSFVSAIPERLIDLNLQPQRPDLKLVPNSKSPCKD